MAPLPSEMIQALIEACLDVGIDHGSLVMPLPVRVAASIPLADTPHKKLIQTWFSLNKMPCPIGERHPMYLALEVGAALSRCYGKDHIFLTAAEHFGEPATLDNAKERFFGAMFTRRTKEVYLNLGCRVTPPLDDTGSPFVVEHPDRRLSVVAVFYDGGEKSLPLPLVISTVSRWVKVARDGGEIADGYIVLAPNAGRKAQVDLVARAQRLGTHLLARLRELAALQPAIRGVRGRGLLAGIELDPTQVSARRLAEVLLEYGVLSKDTHGTVLRLAPPLVISPAELDWGLDRIAAALDGLHRQQPRAA